MEEAGKCPKCLAELTNQNRLVTESCGHSKCRYCFISEENGCAECQQQQEIEQPPKKKEKINIIEDRHLISIFRPVETRKPAKASFPSHIVKESIDNKVVYLCTICDKRFNSRTQQYYHMFCNNSASKPYKCEVCQKTFATSSHLKYHLEGHSKKSLSCSTCGKIFSKPQVLRKHEKLHTAVVMNCAECGAKLKDKVAYKAHMLKHKNIFPHSCSTCGKKFSLKSTLQMHKAIHNRVNKFKCSICEKKFDRNSSLKMHILRHNKLKRYGCSMCTKHFSDAKSLVRHRKIHSSTCMYRCTLCDTTSNRRDNISRHIRNMHPKENKDCIEMIKPSSESSSHPEDTTSDRIDSPPNNCETDTERCDLPKTVPNSSVIKCIGNVQPVIVPQIEDIPLQSQVHSAVTNHKKLKKKYDPREIYRKILLDEESTPETDTNVVSETINPIADQSKLAPETTGFYNVQQSNFSETHWRKNFKYTYQTQFD